MANTMKERELVKRFIDGAYLEGAWSLEVPIPDLEMLRESQGKGEIAKAMASVHSHRIDLVYNCVDEIWILEVKEKPNPSALGQLLVYKALFAEWQGIPEHELKIGLVCEHDNYLLRPILERYGVKVWVI